MLGQNAEDGMVIIQPLAGNTMAKIRRVAERSIGLAKLVQRCTLSQISITGVPSYLTGSPSWGTKVIADSTWNVRLPFRTG